MLALPVLLSKFAFVRSLFYNASRFLKTCLAISLYDNAIGLNHNKYHLLLAIAFALFTLLVRFTLFALFALFALFILLVLFTLFTLFALFGRKRR